MATTADITKKVAALSDDIDTEDPKRVDRQLREEIISGGGNYPVTATREVTLCAKTKYPSLLTELFGMTQVTMAAGANSRDFQCLYDDGAGGSAVALTPDRDGTSTALTQDIRNAFTLNVPATLIPAGSRIYISSTINGTPPAVQDVQFEGTIRYT